MRPLIVAGILSLLALAVAPAAAVALALAVAPAPAAAADGTWARPVPGRVTRGFDLGADPFEGGRHRGADFAATSGAPVRAACGGPVAVAGRVGSSGGVVTVRCGPWRVTHLPLATVAVRRGARVRRGQRLGTVAADGRHAGLHLGVRREGRRFAYVDPVPFLAREGPHPPVMAHRARRGPRLRARRAPRLPAAARAPRLHARRSPPVGAPRLGRLLAPPPPARPAARAPHAARAGPVSAALATGGSRPVRSPAPAAVAPWPAWAGLALLLAGAAGAGARRGGRRGRARAPAPFPRAAAERVR